MKKIACALFLTLGFVACKKETKNDQAPLTLSDYTKAQTDYRCTPAVDKTAADKLIAAVDAAKDQAEKVKLVLVAGGEAVLCPSTIDTANGANADKCNAGKATDTLRYDSCLNSYKGISSLPVDTAPATTSTTTTAAPAATTGTTTTAPVKK